MRNDETSNVLETSVHKFYIHWTLNVKAISQTFIFEYTVKFIVGWINKFYGIPRIYITAKS